ncbi:MAG: hemerythrin domain-containing protein [Bryobacterales bacterium]|nr:hemerythrin domain-containing protein [Bryobacterales bacterium]
MSAANDWNQAPLTDLVRYILEKHHEHLRSELPRLHELLRRAVCAEQAPAQMAEVFGGLWDELDAHLHKEEMILFPSIEQMEAFETAGAPRCDMPFGSIANPIAVMGTEHNDASEAFAQLREITGNFSADETKGEAYRKLMEGLKALDADLQEHIRLENTVLFPRALALEGAS